MNPLLKMAAQDYFPPYFIAMVYIGLGEKDRAFECIEKDFVERSAGMARLKIDPVLDPLRSDPRFTSLFSER